MNVKDIISPARQALGIAAVVIAIAVLAKIFGLVAIRVDTMSLIGAGKSK